MFVDQEGVFQSLGGRDSLLGVDLEKTLEQVDKVPLLLDEKGLPPPGVPLFEAKIPSDLHRGPN